VFVKIFFSRYGSLLVLAVMIVIMTVLSPNFLTLANLFNVSRQISVMAIVAAGMTFVIISNGIDLSVGSVVALCGIVLSWLIQKAGAPVLPSVLAGVAVALLLGFSNGVFIAKLKIPFFIVTLATMVIARGLCFIITGGFPISQLGQGFQQIGRGYWGLVPIPVIVMVLVYLVAFIILQRMRFGRYVYAIGGNETAARLAGIPIERARILIYGLCGACAGIASLILTSRMNSGDPNMGTGLEMDAIASIVIGGTSISGGSGWIWGTFIGAYIIGILNNGLNMLNISAYYQMAMKGLIILLAVWLQQSMQKK
jgi:ribose transport system permease protein